MDKSDTTVVELEKWGEKTLDHARADGLVVQLRAQVVKLGADNRLLTRDLKRAIRAHQRCKTLLASRRERNRELRAQLKECKGKGVGDEQARE